MKFGHLILRKIIKFVATRCQILRLKCIKFNFRPHWGTYSTPQTPKLDLRGLLLREGRQGRKKGRGMGGEREFTNDLCRRRRRIANVGHSVASL